MKPLLLLFYLICSLTFLGCQAKESATENVASPSATSEPDARKAALTDEASPDTKPTPEPVLTERKIIRNATLRFRVEKLEKSVSQITKLTGQFGGIVTQSEETRSDGLLEAAITLRVPAGRLDVLLNELLKESIYTDTKTIAAEDVTRQYVDTDARLKAKKASETRYLQLLQKARNVQEVMAVEEQLRQMREDIEAQEAVLRQLKNDVALSTISLTLYERGEATTEPDAPFYVRAAQNFRDGFSFMGQFIVGAFYFVPLLMVVGVLWWGIRRWNKRRKPGIPSDKLHS